MDAEAGWTLPARVVWVNGSGEFSGAEAVMLSLVERAIADGVDVVVTSPPGPLIDRMPPGVRHVGLPSFGLGGGDGPAGRAAALASLAARTARTDRKSVV